MLRVAWSPWLLFGVATVAALRVSPLPASARHQRPLGCERGLRGGAGIVRMTTTLITNKMCPFAQKAWIALEEKKAADGVAFELEEIGLYGSGGKPAWFLKMNPKGLVPVLKHNERVVVESDDILKYVDEAMGTPGGLSQGQGASVETWFEILARLRASGKERVLGYGSASSLQAALLEVEGAIQGPYLKGEHFSLADIAAAPFFQRMMTEQDKLGLHKELHPKIFAWWALVRERPSFARTVVEPWWWWW